MELSVLPSHEHHFILIAVGTGGSQHSSTFHVESYFFHQYQPEKFMLRLLGYMQGILPNSSAEIVSRVGKFHISRYPASLYGLESVSPGYELPRELTAACEGAVK